jgi:galactose oxidase-like protein
MESIMRKANQSVSKRSSRLRVLTLALASVCAPGVLAQSSLQVGFGQWTTLPGTAPINPVHAVLMHNGKVLFVSGSGNFPTNHDYETAVWDPQAQAFVQQPIAWDMFCNGIVVLPDGRPLINGGTLQYDPFYGQLRNAVYDPGTGLFTDVQSMAHGRWYPTVTTLGDGRVMTFSGLTETGATNTTVEIYTAGLGWSQEYPAGWTPPLYPRMHLLPDGRVFYSGAGTESRLFDPSTKAWSAVLATTNYSVTRTYGSSVLLPLTPENGYKPRVMILGGGNPSTATTEIIDLSAPVPAWAYGPSMSQPRIEMNATILPNGKVLATGGSFNDEDAATASLNADLYDAATNTFTTAGANAFPRLYHSNALLLPDATVLLTGGNPIRGSYEPHLEIYTPAYLFNGSSGFAVRPTITDVPAGPIGYGTTFQVHTPTALEIASVVLVRPGAVTHAFDMDQRLVGLSYSVGLGVLNVTAPPNGNIAPPGYYMLFILNSAGVPSVASFVQLS